ncbi:glycosyl hydrolase family 18 protein [Streptomyces microflavus]|uniref:glycosyl hydrolase family 18 protein n=1 Tax=Streptomyces microflavus TaxID=1919 RepID=UPI001E3F512B|nr:glycosyl hydrolase family 18 protein [Streptomyces microflavus]
MNIGGWSLSQAFDHIAGEPSSRERFADSIARIIQIFPMFTTVHLDWQYPGSAGTAANYYGPEDSENYAALIRTVRAKAPGVTIAISAPGTPTALEAMNIPALLSAGADRINLLAYDLFGSPWAEEITHHAPLMHDPRDENLNSADKAVSYLIDAHEVDPSRIHLVYATHSRNAQQATLASFSPLRGRYTPRDPDNDNTVGTFTPGESEPADILRNYVDLETGKGRNGFVLRTDKVSEADYLYNATTKVFISLDTPRSVKAKAEYARRRGLGGLVAWRADADTGLLANAAREGFGHTATGTTIDMKPLYNTYQN